MRARRAAWLVTAPLALLYASLFIGRFAVPPLEVGRVLLAHVASLPHTWPDSVDTILIEIRLPRAVMALIVGAGLSASGAAYQGMFRNPLVSPDILGVTAASAFGAAVALLLSSGALALQAVSFAFGILGVVLTYLLARVYRTTPVLMLVLSGIVVAAFFSALLGAVKYVADPESKLPAITYWLLGSLNGITARGMAAALLPILLGGAGLVALRYRLNVLAMGEEDARALGLRTELVKGAVIVCTTLITASAVSVCGIVGWVGLVIPHLARMIVGPDHRALVPAAMSIGATYLLFIDDVARTATAGEIPLGILTALIGAPFFAYLLRRTRGTWQ